MRTSLALAVAIIVVLVALVAILPSVTAQPKRQAWPATADEVRDRRIKVKVIK